MHRHMPSETRDRSHPGSGEEACFFALVLTKGYKDHKDHKDQDRLNNNQELLKVFKPRQGGHVDVSLQVQPDLS